LLRALRAGGRGKILCTWTSDLRVRRAALDEASKERLRRREFLTYSRRNKAPKTSVRVANTVPPPPPPLVEALLPQPVQKKEDIELSVDFQSMVGKMNMVVPMVEMCKIPSVR
jgi:hypothetical protein